MSNNEYWIIKKGSLYYYGSVLGQHRFRANAKRAKVFGSYEQADYKRQNLEIFYDLKPGIMKIQKRKFHMGQNIFNTF